MPRTPPKYRVYTLVSQRHLTKIYNQTDFDPQQPVTTRCSTSEMRREADGEIGCAAYGPGRYVHQVMHGKFAEVLLAEQVRARPSGRH